MPPVMLARIIKSVLSSESVAARNATVQKPRKAPLPNPSAACLVRIELKRFFSVNLLFTRESKNTAITPRTIAMPIFRLTI